MREGPELGGWRRFIWEADAVSRRPKMRRPRSTHLVGTRPSGRRHEAFDLCRDRPGQQSQCTNVAPVSEGLCVSAASISRRPSRTVPVAFPSIAVNSGISRSLAVNVKKAPTERFP